jgi:hypothetical protein
LINIYLSLRSLNEKEIKNISSGNRKSYFAIGAKKHSFQTIPTKLFKSNGDEN